MSWNSCVTRSDVTVLLLWSGVKPVESVSRAQDGKPEHFISALTDGRADRWTDWRRGWWSAAANEPSSQTSPALQIHRCMLVLIWTPASLRLILCACRFVSKQHSLRACVWICACTRTGVWVHMFALLHICVIMSKCMHVCIWVWTCTHLFFACLLARLCVFRCVGVLSDQGSVKPGGAQHPHTALELEQRPLPNKCKQLRATSVSIRQSDSSCEQGLWLIASHQINWTCDASREDKATWSPDFGSSLSGFLRFIYWLRQN